MLMHQMKYCAEVSITVSIAGRVACIMERTRGCQIKRGRSLAHPILDDPVSFNRCPGRGIRGDLAVVPPAGDRTRLSTRGPRRRHRARGHRYKTRKRMSLRLHCSQSSELLVFTCQNPPGHAAGHGNWPFLCLPLVAQFSEFGQ